MSLDSWYPPLGADSDCPLCLDMDTNSVLLSLDVYRPSELCEDCRALRRRWMRASRGLKDPSAYGNRFLP